MAFVIIQWTSIGQQIKPKNRSKNFVGCLQSAAVNFNLPLKEILSLAVASLYHTYIVFYSEFNSIQLLLLSLFFKLQIFLRGLHSVNTSDIFLYRNPVGKISPKKCFDGGEKRYNTFNCYNRNDSMTERSESGVQQHHCRDNHHQTQPPSTETCREGKTSGKKQSP